METTLDRPLNQVKLWCCGGLGANLLSTILPAVDTTNSSQAQLSAVLVDTSASNMSATIPPESVYIVEDLENGGQLDGSGQKRQLNYNSILPQVKDIIQSFKPASLNIVLHSLSGGSGSVLAPIITKELLLKGQLVIVLAVSDSSTRIFAENTLNTLKTYEVISQQINIPVIMECFNNQYPEGKKRIDKFIHSRIDDLLYLFSNRNHGLDKQDLVHFLHYTKVCNYEAHLSAFDVLSKGETPNKSLGNPISVTTLRTEDEDGSFPISIEYQAEGILPKAVKDTYPHLQHFVIYDSSLFVDIAKTINKTLKNMDDIRDAQVSKGTFLSPSDKPNDQGMVF